VQQGLKGEKMTKEIWLNLPVKDINRTKEFFSKPVEMQDWMYDSSFVDLDGHRWNMVYMDFGKMPQI
jgi:predicted lactoylglutathione lyase